MKIVVSGATGFLGSYLVEELVREGHLELNQHAAFAPLYVRKRQKTENGGVAAETGNG